MEKGMIGSQAGMWAMTGKDRKTRIIAGEEEKKKETTDSIGSRVHSSLPISTHGPPHTRSDHPAVFPNVMTSYYHSKVPPLQDLPFPVGAPIQRTLRSPQTT